MRSGPGSPGVGLGRRQEGSATVLALAFAVVLLLAGLVAVDVSLLVVARARAQAAADLAALAALTPPGAGAGSASLVASGNGAELVACACGASEAVVTVRTRVRMLPGRMVVSVSARARAVLPEFSPTGPVAFGPAGQAESDPRQLGTPSGEAGGGPWAGWAALAGQGPGTKRAGPGWVPLVMWPGRLRVGSGRPGRVALDAG
jgi:secretion/DNA translocation related TadE-like protein